MKLNESLEKIKSNSVLIEVFGLGYVGFPLAVRLASGGLKVRGVDINKDRISRLKSNELKESELHLKDEFLDTRKNNTLELSVSPSEEILTKIGIICVHTPITQENVSSNTFVKKAVETFLSTSKEGDLIVLESSVIGGTTDEIRKLIETRGFKVGENFGLCFCPERIDPQNKKWNLENIPRIIYCSDDNSFEIIKKIYQYVNDANLLRVDSAKIAEVVKSYENAFRLVNISLVNELAVICDKLGINVIDVIDAAKTKPFGFMPFYPGAGAGGHCIPKDPRFLLDAAKKTNLKFTTIENALEINFKIPIYICDSIERILEQNNLDKSVLVCGLSYKADVEDMRDSPGFKIIKELKSRNFKVAGFDPYFDCNLMPKYLKENYIDELDFDTIEELTEDHTSEFSCLCIVQHHSKNKFKINEIYEKSLVPIIYDCQSKLEKNTKSKTILESFGS